MMEENSSDEFGDCKKAKLDIKSSLQDVKPKIENITLKGEEPSKPWDVDHIGYKLDLDEESCAYNEIKTEPCLLEDAIKADAQDLQSYCVIEVEEKPCILALQAEVEAYSAKHRSGTQDACDQFSVNRLKEDPEVHQKHLQKQRERARWYRSNLKLKERLKGLVTLHEVANRDTYIYQDSKNSGSVHLQEPSTVELDGMQEIGKKQRFGRGRKKKRKRNNTKSVQKSKRRKDLTCDTKQVETSQVLHLSTTADKLEDFLLPESATKIDSFEEKIRHKRGNYEPFSNGERRVVDFSPNKVVQQQNLRSYTRRPPKSKKNRVGGRSTICDSSSEKLSNSQTHKNEDVVVKKGKIFECHVCGKSFPNQNSHRQHLWIHSNKKPHQCSDCGRRFLRKSHFNRHMACHAARQDHRRMRFKCDVCGRAFVENDHLKAHKITHSKEKPFTCEVCGKKCGRKSHLESHLKTHRSHTFFCDLCGKGFREQNQLAPHMASHTGEELFICMYCGRKFNYNHTCSRPPKGRGCRNGKASASTCIVIRSWTKLASAQTIPITVG